MNKKAGRKYDREDDEEYMLDAIYADIKNYSGVLGDLATRSALRYRDLERLQEMREVELSHVVLLLEDVEGFDRVNKLVNSIWDLTELTEVATGLSKQRRQIEEIVYANEKCNTVLALLDERR